MATLTPVGRDNWWATALSQDIAGMYETAHAWENRDPTACGAADRIRLEADVRYGIDPTSLERSGDLDRDASAERERAQVDQAAAVAITTDAAADRAERHSADSAYQAASEVRADELWDSADRRTDTAASLEGVATAEAVSARMLADTGQAKQVRDAVSRAASQDAPVTVQTLIRGLRAQQTRGPRH